MIALDRNSINKQFSQALLRIQDCQSKYVDQVVPFLELVRLNASLRTRTLNQRIYSNQYKNVYLTRVNCRRGLASSHINDALD